MLQINTEALAEKMGGYAPEYADTFDESDLMEAVSSRMQELMNNYEEQLPALQGLMETLSGSLAGIGIDLKEGGSSQEATKRGFETMSQDTASELNGRFTAIQMAVEEIKQKMFESVAYLATMAGKTGGTTPSTPTSISISDIAGTIRQILTESHLSQAAQNSINTTAMVNEIVGLRGQVSDLSQTLNDMQWRDVEKSMTLNEVRDDLAKVAKNSPNVVRALEGVERNTKNL